MGVRVPRTKAFQPAEALDRAMDLFWRDGYAATGLDQLVRRTGASRYGLYVTFGAKRDLFLAGLERYSQAIMDPMLEPLESAQASAREIRAFFDRVLGLIRRPGACGNTSTGCGGCSCGRSRMHGATAAQPAASPARPARTTCSAWPPGRSCWPARA